MKIKRKAMNKIHNEMVRRFTPYWERKNQDIRQLQNAVIEIQKSVQDLTAQVAAQHRAEVSAGDTGKHVAKPDAEIPVLPPVWEARFSVFGRNRPVIIPAKYTYALKNLGIQFELYAGAQSPSHVRVLLQPTRFNVAVPQLEEQMRRLMSAPVKVTWRKVQ